MADINFLIGGGEKLSEPTARFTGGGGVKSRPYSLSKTIERLAPMWEDLSISWEQLPELACPDGMSALAVTLHPTFLAKTYYPQALMNEAGWRHLGSRTVMVRPDRPRKIRGNVIEEETGPQFFFSGDRDRLPRVIERLQGTSLKT